MNLKHDGAKYIKNQLELEITKTSSILLGDGLVTQIHYNNNTTYNGDDYSTSFFSIDHILNNEPIVITIPEDKNFAHFKIAFYKNSNQGRIISTYTGVKNISLRQNVKCKCDINYKNCVLGDSDLIRVYGPEGLVCKENRNDGSIVFDGYHWGFSDWGSISQL